MPTDEEEEDFDKDEEFFPPQIGDEIEEEVYDEDHSGNQKEEVHDKMALCWKSWLTELNLF